MRLTSAGLATCPLLLVLGLAACAKSEQPPAAEPARTLPAGPDRAPPAPAPDAAAPPAAPVADAATEAVATCVPSEPAAATTATSWLPPVAPAPGCLAMTRDGARAAFLLERDDFMPGDDGAPPAGVTRSVAWFGPDDAGPVDLSCLAATCSDAQRAALGVAAKAADLVACRDALAGGIAVGGRVARPAVVAAGEPAAERLVLRRSDGVEAVLLALPMSDGDGGDHKTFKGLYQLPDGPIFVAWLNGDTGLHETGVDVVDVGGLALCAPGVAPPAPR